MKRVILVISSALLVHAIASSECNAQNVGRNYQGVFRTVRNRIYQYETGGIWQQDYMSPYLRALRNPNPNPYVFQRLRPQQTRRRNAWDNRNSLRQQVLTTNLNLQLPSFGGSSPYAGTTGHTTQFMTTGR